MVHRIWHTHTHKNMNSNKRAFSLSHLSCYQNYLVSITGSLVDEDILTISTASPLAMLTFRNKPFYSVPTEKQLSDVDTCMNVYVYVDVNKGQL